MKARALLPICGLVAVTGFVSAPSAGSAQDIETVARQRGIELPAAYYEQIRRDPTAYEFSRALFNRTAPGMTTAPGQAAPARTAWEGIVTLPVVLALFSDSPDPHITRDMIEASLFVGPAEMGTITEAYLEMSRGALEGSRRRLRLGPREPDAVRGRWGHNRLRFRREDRRVPDGCARRARHGHRLRPVRQRRTGRRREQRGRRRLCRRDHLRVSGSGGLVRWAGHLAPPLDDARADGRTVQHG